MRIPDKARVTVTGYGGFGYVISSTQTNIAFGIHPVYSYAVSFGPHDKFSHVHHFAGGKLTPA